MSGYLVDLRVILRHHDHHTLTVWVHPGLADSAEAAGEHAKAKVRQLAGRGVSWVVQVGQVRGVTLDTAVAP